MSDISSAYSGNIEHKADDLAFLSKASKIAGSNALILDLGSGFHCQAAKFFSSPNRQICCIEVDELALRSAMAALSKNTTDGILADITRIHDVFRPGLFDFISCFYSLQHVSKPLDCIEHLVTLGNNVAVSVLLDHDGEGNPLPQFLKSCYSSFLTPGAIGSVLEAKGWQHVSWSRNLVYVESNEFPCAREYVIGRRQIPKKRAFAQALRDEIDDDAGEMVATRNRPKEGKGTLEFFSSGSTLFELCAPFIACALSSWASIVIRYTVSNIIHTLAKSIKHL